MWITECMCRMLFGKINDKPQLECGGRREVGENGKREMDEEDKHRVRNNNNIIVYLAKKIMQYNYVTMS